MKFDSRNYKAKSREVLSLRIYLRQAVIKLCMWTARINFFTECQNSRILKAQSTQPLTYEKLLEAIGRKLIHANLELLCTI